MSKITDELERAIEEASVLRRVEDDSLRGVLNEHLAVIGYLAKAVKELDARLDRAGL